MNATKPYERWVWPGGYEIFAIVDDGGILCIPCCNDESNPVHDDREKRRIAPALHDSEFLNDGWGIVAMDHMGNSDEPEWCDHCGRKME